MFGSDPSLFVRLKQQDLFIEAERDRLAARLPHARSAVRRASATACHRLADWLDNPKRYLQQAESGRVDWAEIR